MEWRYTALGLLALTVTGCSKTPVEPTVFQHETRECWNYHGMMTAPMPPAAMQELKKKCQASMR
ncbi:hypothetical protein ED28_02670 [[Pantoea] beijingensis]|uniref:Lipoprotein n=1 Tax=[Pantoea] beijingensis TaxID=1324864 RepID=A0A443IIS5_9GAMM|nr:MULTISPECIES: hypothetical protein [Erwiniaceae]RWR03910.1 hypothetical protein ED28_02670 [[Pantoea] beijingensis]